MFRLRIGVLLFISGLFWLLLFFISKLFWGVMLSQVQLLLKWVSVVLVNVFLNVLKFLSCLSMVCFRLLLGWLLFWGDIMVQNSEWLVCLLLLLIIGVCSFFGRLVSCCSRFFIGCLVQGVFFSVVFRLFIQVWWCLLWWIFMVSVSMCGFRVLQV